MNDAQHNANAAAINDCAQALLLDPNNDTMAEVLCLAEGAVGNFATAVTSCTQTIALNSQLEPAYNTRCTAYNNLGNYAAAIADCTQAISLNPKDPDPFINRCDSEMFGWAVVRTPLRSPTVRVA